MAEIITVEEVKAEGKKVLDKISIDQLEYVEFQLATRIGFADLQILMKVFQCDLGKLADKVLAYKQGKAKI